MGEEETLICPLVSLRLDKGSGFFECKKVDCAWWCPGEKVCAVKLIAMELMRQKEGR